MIIDFHVHPFVPESQILQEMERADIHHAVLLAVDADPSDVEKPEIKKKLRERHLNSLMGFHSLKPIEDEIRQFFQGLVSYYPELKTSNEDIADLVRRNPEKFIGLGSVNPNKDEEYLEAKLEEIEALKLKGVKMLPTLQLFSPVENENFARICEYCEERKKVLLYHTGCDPGPWENPELSEDANPKHLRRVLEHHKMTIVLAHAGSYSARSPGIWFKEALELGKDFDNVLYDSSAVSGLIYSEGILRKLRKEIGLDRLLYGSDFPVVWGSSMPYEVNVIKTCRFLTEDEKNGILGQNASRILRLT